MKPLLFLTLFTAISTQLLAQEIVLMVRAKYAPAMHGRPAKITTHSTVNNSAGSLPATQSIAVFDSSGMVLSVEHYNSKGSLNNRQVRINDPVNKRVSASVLVPGNDNTYLDTTFYAYNADGHLIRQVRKLGDSSWVTEFTNNEMGLPVSALSYDAKGKERIRETAEYDLKKNIFTVSVIYLPGGKPRSSVHKLDFSKPSRYQLRRDEKYDEHGNCIAYVSTPRSGGEQRYVFEYEYDSRGNWTSMKEYRVLPLTIGQKQVKSLTASHVREIVYFD
jgi:hypothetical protein